MPASTPLMLENFHNKVLIVYLINEVKAIPVLERLEGAHQHIGAGTIAKHTLKKMKRIRFIKNSVNSSARFHHITNDIRSGGDKRRLRGSVLLGQSLRSFPRKTSPTFVRARLALTNVVYLER